MTAPPTQDKPMTDGQKVEPLTERLEAIRVRAQAVVDAVEQHDKGAPIQVCDGPDEALSEITDAPELLQLVTDAAATIEQAQAENAALVDAMPRVSKRPMYDAHDHQTITGWVCDMCEVTTPSDNPSDMHSDSCVLNRANMPAAGRALLEEVERLRNEPKRTPGTVEVCEKVSCRVQDFARGCYKSGDERAVDCPFRTEKR